MPSSSSGGGGSRREVLARRLSRSSTLAALLAVLLLPVPTPALRTRQSTSTAADDPYAEEHVVLADCRNLQTQALSSQMAYFQTKNATAPKDVEQVVTPPGQTRLWAGQTTTGRFSTTGVVFTARLGPQVNIGAYAGTGDNGYPNPFTCWRRPQADLYDYDGVRCSAEYDCLHEAAPVVANTTTSTTPTKEAPPTGVPTQTETDAPQAGLSRGALIGVVVGSVVAAVVAAAAVLFIICRRRRRRRSCESLTSDGAPTDPERPASVYAGSAEGKAKWGPGGRRPSSPPQPSQPPPPAYPQELDGEIQVQQPRPPDTTPARDKDGIPMIAELDGRSIRGREADGT